MSSKKAKLEKLKANPLIQIELGEALTHIEEASAILNRLQIKAPVQLLNAACAALQKYRS